MLSNYRLLIAIIIFILLSPVIFSPWFPKQCEQPIVLSTEEVQTQIRALFNNDPKLTIASYDNQLLEIKLGAQTFFATADGNYLFAGTMLNVQSRQNITELKAQEYRAERIATLSSDMYLSYPANSEQHSVTLFTDIDCGYCRRFHRQLDEINARGITINYIMLPRGGLNSPTFDKTQSVLCSVNPRNNMTLAMRGEFNESHQCQHTLSEQMQLARELGINTTPSLILPDGKLKQGLISSQELARLLTNERQL